MYLGIDFGTSSVKIVLLDGQHRTVATNSLPLSVQRPQPLWSEQHPADWWAATEAAVQTFARSHPKDMAAVQAIGLSGQMHGAVLVDANNAVLRPAILWNDGRSAAQCTQLETALPTLRHITGNLAMPGFTAPKVMWVKQHEPDVFSRTDCILLPKDWLRLMMTGERVSDMSDASGTLWLDVGRRTWSPEVLAACGLTEAHMPRLVEGSHISARLSPEIASRWGLTANIPVAGGAGDNAATAVGMGSVRPNIGFVSLGTSGVIFLTSDQFRPNPDSAVHAFCHALPGTWHQMSVMLSAGSSLAWATQLLGLSNEAELLRLATTLQPEEQARAPLFLPYLGGERTPHNNPNAEGVLFGLTHAHSSAAVAYAVVEGVSFGLLDGWNAMNVDTGGGLSLSLVGGGARSHWWAQLLASTLNVKLHTHRESEYTGALGAARLAWLCDGGTLSEICKEPERQHTFAPNQQQTQLLRPRYARFQSLYHALASQWTAQKVSL